VEKECIDTDAKQLLRGLQLSPKSKINLSPELQILADDVKCAHGATIGQVNDDELFYLESRGIDKVSAKKMLLESFFADLFIGINQKSSLLSNLMIKIKDKLNNV
jgi:Fe-S cluster assembly protein SufD